MWAPVRKASAIIVKTGLKPPLFTCTAASPMKTFSVPQILQFGSTTEYLGLSPILHEHAWCWPPALHQPSPGSLLIFQVCMAPASSNTALAVSDIILDCFTVRGCFPPCVASIGIPKASFFVLCSTIRASYIGISCTGPIILSIRL